MRIYLPEKSDINRDIKTEVNHKSLCLPKLKSIIVLLYGFLDCEWKFSKDQETI